MKYSIGQVVFDSETGVLICQDEVIKPRMKVVLLLQALIENPGAIVTREALIDSIWDGNHYTGSKALNSVVYTLRGLLNDPKQGSNAIQTLPKRGYRLTAQVKEIIEVKEVPQKAKWPSLNKHWSLMRSFLFAGVLATSSVSLAAMAMIAA